MNEETVKNWLQKVDHDLKIGKREMDSENPVTDRVCFPLQQSCEKYLKAFRFSHGRGYEGIGLATLGYSL